MNPFASAFLQFRRSSGPKLAVPIIVAAVVGGVVFTLFSIVNNAATALEDNVLGKDSALAYVVVDNGSTGGGPAPRRGLGPKDIEEIRRIPEVVDVLPWSQVGLLTGDSLTPEGTAPIVVWATSEIRGAHPEWSDTIPGFDSVRPGQIALPERIDNLDFNALLGQTIDVTYQRAIGPNQVQGEPAQLTIAALYDSDAANNDGLTAGYANHNDIVAWSAAERGVSVDDYRLGGIDRAYVQVNDFSAVSSVQKTLQSRGFHAESQASLLVTLQPMFSILRGFAVVLGIVYAGVLVLGGVMFGSFVATIRSTMYAVAVTFGISRRRLLATTLLEVGIIGAVIAFLGVILGLISNAILVTAFGGTSLKGLYLPESFMLPSGWIIAFCLLTPLVLMTGVAGVKLLHAIHSVDPFSASRETA